MIIEGVHSDWRNIEAGVPLGIGIRPIIVSHFKLMTFQPQSFLAVCYFPMIVFCWKKFSLLASDCA